MKLDENFTLTSDSNQYVLRYEKVGDINEKTGKETISINTWYCSSLQSSLKRYLNESCKPAKDIIECSVLINSAVEVINNIKNK